MEITHELLISLGFIKYPGQNTRYSYKRVTGNLTPESSTFYFQGLSPGIGTILDLKYMLMLINYQYVSTMEPYPLSDN